MTTWPKPSALVAPLPENLKAFSGKQKRISWIRRQYPLAYWDNCRSQDMVYKIITQISQMGWKSTKAYTLCIKSPNCYTKKCPKQILSHYILIKMDIYWKILFRVNQHKKLPVLTRMHFHALHRPRPTHNAFQPL